MRGGVLSRVRVLQLHTVMRNELIDAVPNRNEAEKAVPGLKSPHGASSR
jgi:hypothetical protein